MSKVIPPWENIGNPDPWRKKEPDPIDPVEIFPILGSLVINGKKYEVIEAKWQADGSLILKFKDRNPVQFTEVKFKSVEIKQG
jgi:hypothetical protein